MVREGIVLGPLTSTSSYECQRGTKFSWLCGVLSPFYKRFSHIARPLTSLLAKDAPFEFDDECLNAF
jgi:hypothetical protein